MLRVISGSAKGHKLKTVRGDSTRPTSDRVKESLFNILSHRVFDARVLDLFAGTGNLGIEALSRGAASAVFVDRSPESYHIIKYNLEHTKLESKASVMTGDVFNVINKLSLQGQKYDIIFLDPPYHKNFVEETLESMIRNDLADENATIIAERDKEDLVPECVGDFQLVRNQKYGGTVLSFYKKSSG